MARAINATASQCRMLWHVMTRAIFL